MVTNKTKIELDSTVIGIPNATIASTTSTGDNTKDKYSQSKIINTPLPSFIANNIRTTHYEIGPGGKARPTENQDKYARVNSEGAKFSLAPERVEFFK